MTQNTLRDSFEQWYTENIFNLERDPIGSRECGLQWKAWQAAYTAALQESAKTCRLLDNNPSQFDCADAIDELSK